MAVVGPSGCGEKESNFKMLRGNTFYPNYNYVMFYIENSNRYTSKWRNHNGVTFYPNLEFLNSLANCHLIIENSCEEIYYDKEFVKLANGGRLKNNNVIYIKHNLYQQSNWSRTTDLNTTHIILYQSARDIQKFDFLGK